MNSQDVQNLKNLDGEISMKAGDLLMLINGAMWYDPILSDAQAKTLVDVVEKGAAALIEQYPHLEQVMGMVISGELMLL